MRGSDRAASTTWPPPGAIFRVPVVPGRTPPRGVALVAHGGEPLADVPLDPPLTLYVGSEREGLPATLAADCHQATVPLPGEAESLNVAAAGAIALYELSPPRQGVTTLPERATIRRWLTGNGRKVASRPWVSECGRSGGRPG